MARTRKYEVGVGLLLLAAAGVFATLALSVGAFDRFGEAVRLEAHFDDAAGLQPGSVVAIAGVTVGNIETLTLENGKARAVLRVDPGVGVARDGTVRIRARSLLGEKYLEVSPGSGAPAADGDELAVVGRQVEIDELVAMMAPLLEAVDPTGIELASTKLKARLESDPALVDRWFEQIDRTLANASTASDALPGLLNDGKATLGDARSAAKQLDRRARELRPVVTRADRTLANLETASGQLPAMLQRVDVTVERADGLIGKFDAKSERINQILDNLSEIDKWELRRLLREEGIVVRLRAHEVDVKESKARDPAPR